jgi:cell division protein FtsB
MTRAARRIGRGFGRVTVRVLRALAFPVVALATIALVVGIGMFPARAYLDQKQTIAQTQGQLTKLQADNASTQDEVNRLNTDDEIEKVARQQYGLVKPGEEVYHLLPAPRDPLTMPDQWPFSSLRRRLGALAPPDQASPTTTVTSLPAAGPPSTPVLPH